MSSMIPKNVNIWWFHWSWIITRENPSKRFQKQFPDHHKELVNMNGNQSIISRKIAWYFQKKVTTDSFYSDETLGDTKYCLSDTPEIISKLVEEKFRKPPGNINYWTFPPRWTKLCNIHRGGGKFFFLFQREVDFYRGTLQGRFTRGIDTWCSEYWKCYGMRHFHMLCSMCVYYLNVCYLFFVSGTKVLYDVLLHVQLQTFCSSSKSQFKDKVH